MGRFIFALTILGLLAGSLYAVNREDKSVYVLVVRAMISATTEGVIMPPLSQTLTIFCTLTSVMLPCGNSVTSVFRPLPAALRA